MNSLTEVSKRWEGNVVDGKFPLRQWLGGSDHSTVFLTDRKPGSTEKAAIKLIAAHGLSAASLSAMNHGDENLLSRWAVTARISHPNLIALFEFGRCQIEEERFLYVVMEYAEENLGQIVPQRRLSSEEVAEMLPPIIDALSFLHDQGVVHGGIKPSNIFAIGDRVKISADNLHHTGEPAERKNGVYSAPEASTALSPASDVWSMGTLLVTALGQREADVLKRNGVQVLIPEAIPEPYYTIAWRCLKIDPGQRCKLSEIFHLRPMPESGSLRVGTQKSQRRRSGIVATFACIVVLALLIGGMVLHHRETKSSGGPTQQPLSAPAPQPTPVAVSKDAQAVNRPSSVLHQVVPQISRQAQKTIQGRVKVTVDVSVDTSGNVVDEKLASAGPSRYFANKALEASRAWKFTPLQLNGQPSASTWRLRFEFGRAATQVIPTKTKP